MRVSRKLPGERPVPNHKRPPLKLLFYLPSLAGGGAERLLAQLASLLRARGHDIVFVVDTESLDNAAFLSPDIQPVQLGRNHLANVLRWRDCCATPSPM